MYQKNQRNTYIVLKKKTFIILQTPPFVLLAHVTLGVFMYFYFDSYQFHMLELSPKANHNVTKLDLTVPLVSSCCINIDLSIQPMSLTLYITWVHQELHKRHKSWVPCKQISCPQLIHRFGQSSKDYSTPLPNQMDDLSWQSG